MTNGQWVGVIAGVLLAVVLVVAFVPSVRGHVRRWCLVYAAVVLAWFAVFFRRKSKDTDVRHDVQRGDPERLDGIVGDRDTRDSESQAKMNEKIDDARASRDASMSELASAEDIEDTDERLKVLANLVNRRQ